MTGFEPHVARGSWFGHVCGVHLRAYLSPKVKVRRCGNTVENVAGSRSGFTRSAAVPPFLSFY